jgi:hypothetical protein
VARDIERGRLRRELVLLVFGFKDALRKMGAPFEV